MRYKEFPIRHKVMLVLDGIKDYVPGDLRKHNQEIFRISKVGRVPSPSKSRCVYYELDGLTSALGVPYCIDEDWLCDIGVWVGND